MEIDWTALTATVTDTGSQDVSFEGSNILNGMDDYYCSENNAFVNSEGSEYLLVEMGTPISFNSFDLTTLGGAFNPRDWKLEGFSASGVWESLYEATDYTFESSTVNFAINLPPAESSGEHFKKL